jgi:hypothetical protein
MKFRSIKSATTFIRSLRVTRGYNDNATSEWRRLSMKLSNSALIQFARRLASRLETEKRFSVGVDEQDFNPKIHVLDGSKYCVLSLTKRVHEGTGEVTYALGSVNKQTSGPFINVKRSPTDDDLRCAFAIIESSSVEIARTKLGRRCC